MTAPDVRTPGDSRDGFRPDLEGLRAVAVVLVLLYHASVPGFAGGYIGVDVFFVLSGFLITGLLLREVRRTGTISLPAFYARRARRLLPASALVLLVTVAGSALLLPPLLVPDVAGDAAAASLYVSNMRFAFQATDYLQSEMAPSPLLHFWSLGVEEQFYVFWPALVLLIARGRSDAGRRVAIAVGIISVASFGLALWLTEANAPWAFFSLPTRAWELGLGAFLAIGGTQLARVPARPAAVAAWVGLAMVAISGMVLSTETPFPGTAALLPTFGSALVIAGGFRQESPFAPGRWLALAIPRFLGRISYSLYLWHWPVLLLPAAALGAPLPWWARGALVLVSIGLAAATQRWVEDPLRHGRGIGTLPRRNLAMAGALSLVVAMASLGVGASMAGSLVGSASPGDVATDEADLDRILSSTATPTPSASSAASPTALPAASPTALPATAGRPVPPGLRPSLAEARSDEPRTYSDGCHVDQAATTSPPCVYGVADSPVTVVLLGDSHAAHWFPAVERLALERGWRLLNLTKSGCGPADVIQYNGSLKREYLECAAWRTVAERRVADEHPALVLVSAGRGVGILSADTKTPLAGAARIAAWQEGMTATLTRLAAAADRVVVIADTPRSAFDVPVCLSAHLDDVLACATPFNRAANAAWTAEERR
ncbi:MAG: acyltransferase family protein, partial [Chloroflexota bacterium]